MARMASQAEEGRRLMQQVVGHRPMRLVANRAILRHRRMLIGERPLFLRLATVTDQIHGRLLEIALGLAVRIMAIGAQHLAFFDRMVRRHRVSGIDVAVALVAGERLVDGHRQARRPPDVRVLNVDKLVHVQIWMRIMAVGTGDAVLGMR